MTLSYFLHRNSIVTHRIVDILSNDIIQYTTKGDANNSEDINKVEYKNIEGRYVLKIPKLGGIIVFMQNKVGIALIVLLIYILYVLNRRVERGP